MKSIWIALVASVFCFQPLHAALYLYVEVAQYDTFYFDDPVTFYDFSFNLRDDNGLVSETSFIRSDGFNAMTRPADVGDTLASLKPYLIGDWTANVPARHIDTVEIPGQSIHFSISDFQAARIPNAAELATTGPVTSPLALNFQANDGFTWTLGNIQHENGTSSPIAPTPQGELLTFDSETATFLELDFYTYSDGNDILVMDTSQSEGLTGDLFFMRFNTTSLAVTAVPEPSTILLFALAVAGFALVRRHKIAR